MNTSPIQAIIFDWAGTTVDFGSCAPILAFQRLFADQGVEIDVNEARAPMGLEKRDHIVALLKMPRIAQVWRAVHGQDANETDIDRLYQEFIPHQLEAIPQCADLIPGALETFKDLRNRKIKIGSNTGYASMMMPELIEKAAQQGYLPDCIVTATDVTRGRPYPDMLWKNLMQLGTSDIKSVVKVDDTVVGIYEGLNAGCWTVGLAVSGNEVGMSYQAWQNCTIEEQGQLKTKAYKKMQSSGAHYVIDTIADLPSVLDQIEIRLAQGETP